MYETSAIGKEDPETTITNLGAYVKNVHIHDYRTEDGKPVVPPDYTLKRRVDTKMGNVARYLIKKNGNEVGDGNGD